MPTGRHRIIEPTMAMFEEGGRHFPLNVPTDSIILIDGSLAGDRLTDVLGAEIEKVNTGPTGR